MILRIRHRLWILGCLAGITASTLQAQQKGQYVPGQWGLNPGVIPEAGISYANMPINYSANKLNDSNKNHRPNILGTYAFWVDENIFFFVTKGKSFGAYYAPYISINPATGSLVADLASTNLGTADGGSGLGDTWVEPANLAWRLKRADINLGYAFMAPTGRFVPGASDNAGRVF